MPSAPEELADAARRRSCPGVGHFGATRALERRVDRGDPRARRRRAAAARHLPRHAVALRRQRRGARRAGARAAERALLSRCGDATGRRCRMSAGTASRCSSETSIVEGVAPGAQVYFTHSYVGAGHRRHRRGRPSTARPFAAIVERGHVAGVQFHPEKSGEVGLRILRNFIGDWLRVRLTMLSKRIIACLDVRDGQVVKGVNFEGLRIGRRSGGARAPLQRRGHRRAGDPRHHRDDRGAARARRHHPRASRASCSSRSPSAAASAPKPMRRRRSRRAPTR